LHQYENALKSCVKSIHLDPYFVCGYYEMGYIYRHLLNMDDNAMICYSCVIQISGLLPKVEDVTVLSISHQNVGSILLNNKNREGLNHLNNAIAINPSNFTFIKSDYPSKFLKFKIKIIGSPLEIGT
jgi:hypothetical protein